MQIWSVKVYTVIPGVNVKVINLTQRVYSLHRALILKFTHAATMM